MSIGSRQTIMSRTAMIFGKSGSCRHCDLKFFQSVFPLKALLRSKWMTMSVAAGEAVAQVTA